MSNPEDDYREKKDIFRIVFFEKSLVILPNWEEPKAAIRNTLAIIKPIIREERQMNSPIKVENRSCMSRKA